MDSIAPGAIRSPSDHPTITTGIRTPEQLPCKLRANVSNWMNGMCVQRAPCVSDCAADMASGGSSQECSPKPFLL